MSGFIGVVIVGSTEGTIGDGCAESFLRMVRYATPYHARTNET